MVASPAEVLEEANLGAGPPHPQLHASERGMRMVLRNESFEKLADILLRLVITLSSNCALVRTTVEDQGADWAL
jgi:hypothetical protein